MTREEARIAVKLNAIVKSSSGLTGYAYSLLWTHEKGKDSYESIGVHDLRANSVCMEKLENVSIVDWQAPEYLIRELRERIKL